MKNNKKQLFDLPNQKTEFCSNFLPIMMDLIDTESSKIYEKKKKKKKEEK